MEDTDICRVRLYSGTCIERNYTRETDMLITVEMERPQSLQPSGSLHHDRTRVVQANGYGDLLSTARQTC